MEAFIIKSDISHIHVGFIVTPQNNELTSLKLELSTGCQHPIFIHKGGAKWMVDVPGNLPINNNEFEHLCTEIEKSLSRYHRVN
ncbi:hypothetical protein GCM10023149_09620 [Mucilaginibacter gynuensis]|uniref:Uncharacterized protein n=1 Tax=Mucilaginibacter gynuensis TaxID=1302236 RepID=A0ABP8FYQ1_9SPHI